jgi:para-aminobenzoate synthetase component 1
MIVDLERSDLGRVCKTASVHVPAYAQVESYATVHHLVSTIRGALRADVETADILRATFPGGSITGAPKIRAMEIIAEVEPQARGVYTGAIGCFNGHRAIELSVAIRTAVAGGGRVHHCVGGGIVADSSLDAEYEETNVKARAFHEAFAGTPAGARVAV